MVGIVIIIGYRLGSWGTDWVNNMLRVSQPISGSAGIWI